MSLEEALRANTEALKENTAAHKALADVAVAAASSKSAPAEKATEEKAPEEKAPPKETAAQKKKRLAAEKKAKAEAEAAAKKAEEPELETDVEFADLQKVCAALLDEDREDYRDEHKANFIGALKHLGAKKLTDVDEDDYARLAGYVAYWEAGLDVDFEAIDEKLVEAAGGEDDDNPLG